MNTSNQPPTREEFDRALEQLRFHASRLNGGIDIAFPPGEHIDPLGIPGHSWDYPLKSIASVIDDVLASFDILQRSLGEDYPRHERFLTGKCR